MLIKVITLPLIVFFPIIVILNLLLSKLATGIQPSMKESISGAWKAWKDTVWEP